MNLRRILLIIGTVLAVGLAAASFYVRKKEKSLSPERQAKFNDNGLKLSVNYSAPYKRGRKIFGALVPFGKLWRTGANEATVFYTGNVIYVNGQVIPEGRYHLVTIPYPEHWTIILNSDIPGWGIDIESGDVYNNSNKNVLMVDVPVKIQDKIAEQFEISFEGVAGGASMVLMWDDVRVTLPLFNKQ